MTETGNPNVFTLYKGVFNCTDINADINFNGKVALTSQGDVIFLDNIETIAPVSSYTVLFKLPTVCRPNKEVRVNCNVIVKTVPTSNVFSALIIKPNGEVSNATPWTNVNLVDAFIFGNSFNISGNYYG